MIFRLDWSFLVSDHVPSEAAFSILITIISESNLRRRRNQTLSRKRKTRLKRRRKPPRKRRHHQRNPL